MKLRLITVGGRPARWVADGFAEYARRLPRELSLELVAVPAVRGAARKGQPVARTLAEEGRRVLRQVSPDDRVVALDAAGEVCSTEHLAEKLDHWRLAGRDVAFLVGGADGLDPGCLARADETLSLSRLTFPHELVRVIVAEQLYRAWTVLNGHPYHRS